MKLTRSGILNLNPYIAGKPIEETKRQLGLKEVIKLASNENPLGPSPLALKAARRVLAGVNRYPDAQGFYLKRRLARYFKLYPSNFVIGNGSDELIDIIIKTFVEPDESIITADITFLEYKIVSEANGRRVIEVPLKYFKYDLDAIRRKIDKKTKLIFISNPNNPTGTYLTSYQMKEFFSGLPEGVLVVLDEAYDAFIDVDDFPNALSRISAGNLVILKTFSKAYGLAGLRAGYAIADRELTSYMERVRQPFNVNSIAQAAAAAALEDKKFLARTRQAILAGKDFLYTQLQALGLAYVPSAANFILVDVGRDSRAFFRRMLSFGVIVRDMRQYGLKNFIRVTIGTKKENERFIKVLKKIL